MTRVFVFTNHKGGTAKSTSSTNAAYGIVSMLLKDNASGMLPFLDVLHPVRLVVRHRDVDTAVRLLDATAASDPKGKPPLLS